MNDNQDERLSEMLGARRLEAASPDLAARIILQAQSLPQLQNLSIWQAMRQLCAEFHLPKPGYVLASALVLGMVLGYGMAPDNGQLSDADMSVSHNYIVGDESFL
jgi:hypothetical protein